MKHSLWLIITLISLSTTAWGQSQLLHTYDFGATTHAFPFEESVSIPPAFYKLLLVSNPATSTVKLTNVPATVMVKANDSWYSVSNTGSDWIVTFPTHEFLKRYSKGESLMLLGLEGGGVAGTIQYTLGQNPATRPLTPGNLGNTIVRLDICPDAKQPLTVWSNGKARKWLYVRNKESVTFQVQNINPSSYTVAVNGDVQNILVDSEGAKLFDNLSKASADGAAGGGGVVRANMTDFNRLPVAEQIAKLQTTVDRLKFWENQFSTLKNILNQQLNQPCLTEDVDPRSFTNKVKSTLGEMTVEDFRISVETTITNLESYLGPTGLPSGNSEYKRFDVELKRLKALFTDDAFSDVENQINKIKLASQNRTLSSLPVTVNGKNGDVVRFTVDKVSLSPTAKQSATYDVFISGGIKIDVSAGIFMNGLVDETYVGREVPPVSTGTSSTTAPTRYVPVKEEPSDKSAFAAGALLHAYPRLNLFQGAVNIGISAGISAGSQVSYYGGFSALFGRQQRVVLSGGWAWGKVKRLSSIYEKNDDGKFKDYAVTGGQFATRDVMTRSWFIGFTYNLGSSTAKAANDK